MGKNKCSEEMKEQTVKYVLEGGKSATKVSKELGIDTNTVCRWVREYRTVHEMPTYEMERKLKKQSVDKLAAKNKELEKELIRAVALNKMVFKHIQNVLSYIQQFEATFVKDEMEKANAERAVSIEKAKVDIVTLKRRDEDIDTLFKRIYEDMVAGRISAERFEPLSSDYEEEQKQVKAAIAELAELIESGEEEQHDLNRFLQNVRKYTDPQELTGEILNDLVDKIIVHAPDKSSGHRKQKIEIYYKAVGIIDMAEDFVLKRGLSPGKMICSPQVGQ